MRCIVQCTYFVYELSYEARLFIRNKSYETCSGLDENFRFMELRKSFFIQLTRRDIFSFIARDVNSFALQHAANNGKLLKNHSPSPSPSDAVSHEHNESKTVKILILVSTESS